MKKKKESNKDKEIEKKIHEFIDNIENHVEKLMTQCESYIKSEGCIDFYTMDADIIRENIENDTDNDVNFQHYFRDVVKDSNGEYNYGIHPYYDNITFVDEIVCNIVENYYMEYYILNNTKQIRNNKEIYEIRGFVLCYDDDTMNIEYGEMCRHQTSERFKSETDIEYIIFDSSDETICSWD